MNNISFFSGSSLKYSAMAIAITIALISKLANAAEELDMSFIQGGTSLDKEAWNTLNSTHLPGRYLVDIIINGKKTGKQILDITPQDSDGVCLTKEWLNKANIIINTDFFKEQYDHERQCYNLSKGVSTKVNLDISTQSLELHIPQDGLGEEKENVEWEYGTSAIRMNYNLNANSGTNYSSAFGSADLKYNIGNWVVSSTLTSISDKSGNNFSLDILNATRAIRILQADLAVGKVQPGDTLLGSTGAYGVSLTRNNSMVSGNLGYSPVFSGIASSPSRVTLSQEGRILYSEVVPQGPFSIRNISLYTSGDVRMIIKGEDGREHIQDFPVTMMTGLLNVGQHEFNISGGFPDDDSDLEGGILSASYGYGFNRATLKTGIALNDDYQGISAGLITGLGNLGAVSAEGAWSTAKYDSESTYRGSKSKLTWSKKIEATSTGLRVSWSKALNDKFTDLSGFNPTDVNSKDKKRRHVKDEWNFGISQPVNGLFSLSISGWQRDYHNYPGKDSGLSGSLSTQIGSVNLNLGASGSKKSKGDNDWAVSASVSIPFSIFDRRYNSHTSVTSSKGQGVGFSSGVSGSINDKFSYGISGGRDSQGGISSSLNMSYSGDKISIGGSLNHSTDNGSSGSFSASGSILGVPSARSVMFSKTTSETVAVVNVKDTPGVRVLSGVDQTDEKGNLVVPLNSYDWNSVTIEAGSLPLDTELVTTSKKIVPTDKAVVWMPFEPVKVKRYLLQIKKKNGEFIAGGTWARDSRNTPIGFVANNGVLMINVVDNLENIILGDCKIPSSTLIETEKLQEVVCE